MLGKEKSDKQAEVR